MIIDRKLNILHIASGDLWAGAEVQILTLCKNLVRSHPVQLEVVLMNSGELERRLKSEGIIVTVLDESGMNALQIFKQLIKIYRRFQPDIIHTHRQKENILGTFANSISVRAKSVRTVHGAPEHRHMSLKNFHKNIYTILDILSARFLQDRIISVTEALKLQLESDYANEKLTVIYNGVDIPKKRPITTPSKSKFKVALAGRIVPVKRVDIFLHIARAFYQRNDADDFEFHIFGDGPLLNEMKQLAHNNELHSYVTFHGHVNNISEQLTTVDLLIMCSDHEGMPMIALEGVSSGTPVLAHAVGGLVDLLKTDNNDFLVEDNTAENYVGKMIDIQQGNADDIFEKLVESCHRRFSAGVNARQTFELYQSLITA